MDNLRGVDYGFNREEWDRFRSHAESVLDKLARMGWVKSYVTRDLKGFAITWTAEGDERGMELQAVILQHQVKDATMVAALGAEPVAFYRIPPKVLLCWQKIESAFGACSRDDRLMLYTALTRWCPTEI